MRWWWRQQQKQMNFVLITITIMYCVSLNKCLGEGTKCGTNCNLRAHKTCEHNCQSKRKAADIYPYESKNSLFQSSKKHVSNNCLATKAQILNDSMFLAVPRYRTGVPATLIKTSIKSGGLSSNFIPYPSSDMQRMGDCTALQSVVDLVIDQNEIIWVLDTGIVNGMKRSTWQCSPKVLAISSKTNKILKKINLSDLTDSTSDLQYLAVDYNTNSNCFLYISDAAHRAIIVFNIQDDYGYKFILPKTVANDKSFDKLYIALIRQDNGAKQIYITYLSGTNLYFVNVDSLNREVANNLITDRGRKPSSMVLLGTDNGSAIFFRNEDDAKIYRWDTSSSFAKENFQFVYCSPTGLLATHVLPDYKRNAMRVLESNFLDFMDDRMDREVVHQLSIMQGF